MIGERFVALALLPVGSKISGDAGACFNQLRRRRSFSTLGERIERISAPSSYPARGNISVYVRVCVCVCVRQLLN